MGLVAAACLVDLALVVWWLGSTGADDAHITYWAAHALGELGGLFNYEGVHLEQSSSLTLVVLLAGLRKLTGVALPTLGYLTGLAAAALAVVQSYRLAERLVPTAGAGAALIVGTCWCFVYWSASGMETALAAALGPTLVLAVEGALRHGSVRRLVWLAITALLFVACRPENVIIAPCVAAALVVHQRRGARAPSTAAMRRARRAAVALLMLVPLALVGWRLLVTGMPFPIASLAKVGQSPWRSGSRYLWQSLLGTNLLLLVMALPALGAALRATVRGTQRDRLLVLVAALAGAQLGFIVTSGGDWMEAGRFLAPAVPALAALCITSLRVLLRRRERLLRFALLVALAGAVRVGGQLHRWWHHLIPLPEAMAARERLASRFGALDFSVAELASAPHLRDTLVVPAVLEIIDRLEPTAAEPVYLASGQAGMIPFYVFQRHAGRARFLDLYGLTSPWPSSCLRSDVGRPNARGTPVEIRGVIDAKALEGDCGLPRPTIVYSNRLRKRFVEAFRRHGYRVVYHQRGMLYGDRRGYNLEAFVAVERGAARRLRLRPRRFRWRSDDMGRRPRPPGIAGTGGAWPGR